MSKPFTFGVELEFHVGYLKDSQAEPSPQSKFVRFPAIPNEAFGSASLIAERRIFAHISQTIARTGKFPIDLDALSSGAVDVWEIEGDASLRDYTDAEGYSYRGVEVKSPALPFNEASLKQIEAMCKLLTDTYRLESGIDTGLHIHLGHEKCGFEFQNIQKLMIFLYTFEPQLSSLHPPHRLEHDYGNSPRTRSMFSANFQAKYGRAPSARDFATEVYSCREATETRNRHKLISKTFKDLSGHKDGNYNFSEVRFSYDPFRFRDYKQTIEFRQHEGTLDGEKIGHWIHVIIAIVQFVETDVVNFHRLMQTMWKEERWEKIGDGNDARRAAEMGPVLADYGFTIIDLLRYLGKDAQADYFSDKWQKHDIPPRYKDLRSDTTWEFMRNRDPEQPDRRMNGDLVALYAELRLLNRAERKAGEEQTEIDDDVFPKHDVDPQFLSDDEKDEEEADQRDIWDPSDDEEF